MKVLVVILSVFLVQVMKKTFEVLVKIDKICVFCAGIGQASSGRRKNS
jgi:hypothetical protein